MCIDPVKKPDGYTLMIPRKRQAKKYFQKCLIFSDELMRFAVDSRNFTREGRTMRRTHSASVFVGMGICILFFCTTVFGQSPSNPSPRRAAWDDPPPYKLEPWWEFPHRDHPTFGARLAGLGDVNKDGGNDFAVSTCTDTTFIFFGGKALNDFPDAWVWGGGWKIIPGDFNGDGYIDLAVSNRDLFQFQDKLEYGYVRIYLNNQLPSVYNHEPSLTIKGKDLGGQFGNEIKAGDLNGDGFTDLIISAPGAEIRDSTDHFVSCGKIYLFLGKPHIDTIPDHIFYSVYKSHDDWISTAIGYESGLSVSDINGDGYDDILFNAGEHRNAPNLNHISLAIYYGNVAGRFGSLPDQQMNNDFYFFFVGGVICTAKINGDNVTDMAFPSNDPPNKDLSVVWGRNGGFFPPLPDGVFENPDPAFYEQGGWLEQVGDINGDGFDDYFVGWLDRSHAGVIMEMYRGGKNWEHHAIAYYPILGGRDYYSAIPIPLHDIDGDGIDDFGLEKAGYCNLSTGDQDRVMMFRGTRKIPPISRVERLPEKEGLYLFPSPVRDELTIKFDKYETSVNINIFDSMGRVRKNLYEIEGIQAHVDITDLPSGVYLAVMGKKGVLTTKKLIVSH